jgi:diadenosine tetraphosphate (Ap4A) HIT family hydrolase
MHRFRGSSRWWKRSLVRSRRGGTGVAASVAGQVVALRAGYAYVIWRGRHVAEPTELSDVEASGYWSEVLLVARAIERLYTPCKMNYQLLGNAVPHLHAHLVPRYLDDPAPGKPLPSEMWDNRERQLFPEPELRAEVEALRELINSERA